MVFLDADEIDEYARESVAFVKNLGIVSGDDEGSLTRRATPQGRRPQNYLWTIGIIR